MIRKATVEDLREVLELERKCFKDNSYSREQIQWFLEDGGSSAYLYVEDGSTIGALMMSSFGRRGKIVSIGVHPNWRRRGIGRKLMAWGEKRFTDAGVKRSDLEVYVGNREAIAFYESLGYQKIKVLKDYYGGELDAYLMRKKVS